MPLIIANLINDRQSSVQVIRDETRDSMPAADSLIINTNSR
jgi:hypothetical protein